MKAYSLPPRTKAEREQLTQIIKLCAPGTPDDALQEALSQLDGPASHSLARSASKIGSYLPARQDVFLARFRKADRIRSEHVSSLSATWRGFIVTCRDNVPVAAFTAPLFATLS